MPNRILRDGILSSEPVCSLGWAEEVFYRRLMSVVDDHGRFHALPKLIRAACYPLQIDKVSDADIGKWIAACATAGLVSVYPAADGKRYIEIVKFGQQVRSKSKYPPPVDGQCAQPKSPASNCSQVKSDAHLDEGGDEDEDDVNPPKPPKGVSRAVSFQTWAKAIREAGEKLVPDDDPVFDYATTAGIPHEFVALAWGEFKSRHCEPGAKMYKDFRRAFRNCVRGNWYRLWICDANGYRLSTNGEQAERVAEKVAA